MQIHELNTFPGRPGETDFIPVDSGFDTSKISADNLLKYHVKKPLDGGGNPYDGDPGQLLRTKGDGSTEWTDVGNPTDAQTAQAVSDWLDAHPEATTTVQDGSLTLPKFKPGELPFVTPEQYGAIGDGVTDDTAAWQSAVDSGFNVRATKKIYKVGQIDVTNNIEIDFNDADFICSAETFLYCHGEIVTTLTGENNYSANDNSYAISNGSYSGYTGFAMLKGTNNFEKSRAYYTGGFVCTFTDGIINGSYPIDVTKAGGIDIEIINPITVYLHNLGNVSHSITTETSLAIRYGMNCVIENVNADNIAKYTFIRFASCLSCICRDLNIHAKLGTTGTNSYIVAFEDSSYCSLEDSYLFNKYWHCATTGATYLCYFNSIINCTLLSDGTAYSDHENGKNTIIRDCVISCAAVTGMAVIENCTILSNNVAGKPCAITMIPSSDEKTCMITVRNIKLIPNPSTTVSNCGIVINGYPTVTGQTYYIDDFVIENVTITRGQLGQIWFGFMGGAGTSNFVVRRIKIINAPLDIYVNIGSSDSGFVDITDYRLYLENINTKRDNASLYPVVGTATGIFGYVFIRNCSLLNIRYKITELEMHNVYVTNGLSSATLLVKKLIGSGLDLYFYPNLFYPSDATYDCSYVRISDLNYRGSGKAWFNLANDNVGNKYYQEWINGVLTTTKISV